MARRKSKYQVFVSHATADKWVVRMICKEIETVAGAATFRDDRDIKGGDDIPDALLNRIRQSAEVVVLFTPASVNRQWITLEIGAAWASGKLIVPICYHVDVTQIPQMLTRRKAYNLNELDSYLAEIADRVKERGL